MILVAFMTEQQQQSLQDYDEKMKKLHLAMTGFTRQIAPKHCVLDTLDKCTNNSNWKC